MTDAERRTTGRGGLLGAFDGAMAGITEADVAAAALEAPEQQYPAEASASSPAVSAAAPPARSSAGGGNPDPPETVLHRDVDPRARAVADRLLGRAPAVPDGEPNPASNDQSMSQPARLVAAEGGAVAECGPASTVSIGRADGDLVVPLGVVSRRHCQVSRIGERYVVADLGSANGTLVCRPDGSTTDVTAEPVELHPGDVLATARGRRPIARLEPGASAP